MSRLAWTTRRTTTCCRPALLEIEPWSSTRTIGWRQTSSAASRSETSERHSRTDSVQPSLIMTSTWPMYSETMQVRWAVGALLVFALTSAAGAETIKGTVVTVPPEGSAPKKASHADVVVWLEPAGGAPAAASSGPSTKPPATVRQRDKSFAPHL